MDKHIPQQSHRCPPDHDSSEVFAENPPVTVDGNIDQSPGSLFVAQTLSKQNPRDGHTLNPRASVKHNLDAPDASDIHFAPLSSTLQPPTRNIQLRPSSFGRPLAARGTGSRGDGLQPHVDEDVPELKTSSLQDSVSNNGSPSRASEHEREYVQPQALPQTLSRPNPSDIEYVSVQSSEREESPQSEGCDTMGPHPPEEDGQETFDHNTFGAKGHPDAQTPRSSPPLASTTKQILPAHINAVQARSKRATPEQIRIAHQMPQHDPRYRVHKPQGNRAQTIPHHASTAAPLAQEHAATPAANVSRKPSDEDLLMLVMRRNRIRDESVTRLHNDHERLKNEHAQLQAHYKTCQQRLQENTKQWHASVQGNHVQEAQVRAFREKYAKLKQWAQDMSKEYEGLRSDGNNLTQDIQAIKADGKKEANERKELLAQCDAAISNIGAVRSNIAALRAESVKLESLEERLAHEQGRLREEKLRNKSHALYIERLESMQRSMNTSFSNKQDHMAHELTKVAGLIGKQQYDGLSSALGQIVEAVEQIRQHDAARSGHKEELQTMLTAVGKHYDDFKELLDVVKNAQIDQHTASNLQFSSLVDAVDKLGPDLERLKTLEHESSSLSAKLKENEARSKSADREKNVAQLFCSGLLQAHKDLVRDRPQAEGNQISTKINELNATNSRLSSELQSSRKDVINLQNELSKAQELGDNLRANLADQKDSHKAELERVDEQSSARVNELENQLNAKAAEVTSKQDELQNLEKSIEALQSKVKELKKGQKELEQRVQDRDGQISSKVKDIENLQNEKQQLEQYLGPFENIKGEISGLKQKCKDYDVLAKQLKQAQADNGSLEKNSAEARTRCTDLEQRLEHSNRQLDELLPLPEEIKTLQQTSSKQAARIKELSDAHSALEEQLQQVPGLRKEIEDSTTHIDELKGKLKVAEVFSTQVAELQGQLETFQTQKDDLAKVQTKLKEKSRTVQDLQQQLSNLKDAEFDLQKVQGESQQREVEMAAMQDRINKLEEESRRFDSLREHITDEEIAAFSEPIVLSLKSIIHQSQSPRKGGDHADRHANDEDTFVRPRRAANRGACDDDAEAVVVPDSQSQGRHLANAVTSDLSSPPDFLDDMPSMFDIVGASQGTIDTSPNDATAPLPTTVASKRSRDEPELRPGTSNSEMLLRSSDAANFSPGQDPRRGRAQVLVPASAHGASPMKTRTGVQIRHSRDSTPVPRMDPGSGNVVNFSSPHTHPRENHAPNSAAKRRAEEHEPTAKRHKADMKRLATRPAATAKSTRFSDTDTVYDLPASARKSGSTIGTPAPAPGKTKKKTNTTTRKSSKHSQYSELFSQAESV
ncbi:hypothetical protein PMZ80_000697 [Knufia obscura]|uniref:Uncharacterized protein n=1 Tax=Knufia obscura TaxID=1635080 RepID=A0ABR0S2G8_9EURO|nr:hypothetical protein PMZ80_000697 [Knufia obscura]